MAVYNHYKRLQQPKDDDGVEIEKEAISSWLVLQVRVSIACSHHSKNSFMPFTIVDATTYCKAGYVGRGCESILLTSLSSC